MAGHSENKKLVSIVGDICEPETIEYAFEGVDYVFHCAAYINFQYPTKFDELERVNVMGNLLYLKLMDALRSSDRFHIESNFLPFQIDIQCDVVCVWETDEMGSLRYNIVILVHWKWDRWKDRLYVMECLLIGKNMLQFILFANSRILYFVAKKK